jgi:hypothetical protein
VLQFDPTVNLGSIAIVISILTMAVTIGRRFGAIEQTVKDLERSMTNLARVFESHEGHDDKRFKELRDEIRDRRRWERK